MPTRLPPSAPYAPAGALAPCDVAALVARLTVPAPPVVRCPTDALATFERALLDRETEALACMALDKRNRIIDMAVLTTGTVDCTVVDPRQILRWVLTRSKVASGFMLAHNHPSGDSEPSTEDIRATSVVATAARAVGLSFLDHIVVAGISHTSMAQRGLV